MSAIDTGTPADEWAGLFTLIKHTTVGPAQPL
jgi:hypothetical protein